MKMATATAAAREERTALSGSLTYRHEPGEQGRARWLNVTRVGASIRLGRYLRPGRLLHLSFANPLDSGAQADVAAQVAWCRLVPGSVDFEAGLRIMRDAPEMALAFAALGYEKVKEMNRDEAMVVSLEDRRHGPRTLKLHRAAVVVTAAAMA